MNELEKDDLEILNIKTSLSNFWIVQNRIDHSEFVKMFGSEADHLWRQYSGIYKFNLLNFWHYLSTDKRLKTKFAGYVWSKLRSLMREEDSDGR